MKCFSSEQPSLHASRVDPVEYQSASRNIVWLEKWFAAMPFGLGDIQTAGALNTQVNGSVFESAPCVSQCAVVISIA